MNRATRTLAGGLAAYVVLFSAGGFAAIPTADKLLPDDTLVLVTAPDFAKLSQASAKNPRAQLWNDPAMKPFKDKFMAKWNDEFVQPLERDLGIKLADYTALFQGQLTFAMTQNGWKGHDDEEPGLLLLVDAKDKADQLKKNVADLRKKWTDAGKSLKTEKVRDVELLVLPVSSNDVPKTLRKFFPKTSKAEEIGDDKAADKPARKDEVIVAQADSLLILANSVKAAEAVIVRLRGGTMPALADSGAYQANQAALFRDAPLCGWVNVKAFMNILIPVWSEKKENPDAPNPFDIAPDKILNALGLTALKTVAATARQSEEGTLLEIFFGVPEANRQGLFKILAGEPKEANPPPFVPADALKFQRWRMDGRKAWTSLEQALAGISPQAVNTLNFVLDSANTYAKEKDPDFDIRKNLIGNLGDDIITFEKRGSSNASTEGGASSNPSLVLIGSPNSDQFVAALKGILVFLSQQTGAAPQEREFLGRKIYSVPIALPGRQASGSGKTPLLNYGASSGYVALSTDAAILEEFFRAADSQSKPLRQVAGLADAAQKVSGPGSSLFGYENDVESMRATFDLLRKSGSADSSSSSSPAAAALLPIAAALGSPEKMLKEWCDFSVLPSFDKLSKYFHFSVYGGTATVEGLSLKLFTPLPPGLK